MSIVALVPMRHRSERIPGKNYRLFDGLPLFYHIVGQLIKCPMIDDIVIDTDSTTIQDAVRQNFPSVHLLERPDHLREGTTPINDVLLHDVHHINADFYLQTHSTNPLLRAETISKAIEFFLDVYPSFDSLFSVTRVQTRLWDSMARAINHNPAILLRTQDLPPIFEENSCIYIFTKEILETNHNRVGSRPYLYEIDPIEAWDIDEELDFDLAEFVYLRSKQKE